MPISATIATPADAAELAANMRPQDRAEVEATGQSPVQALITSMNVSAMAWTVRYDGKIMAMWGVVEIDQLGGKAIAWLLTSPEVEKHPRAFVRISVEVIAVLRTRYKVLMNFVDARYGMALRWAKRMGFEIIPQPRHIGLRGEPFYLINMKGV